MESSDAAKRELSFLFQNWELLNGFPIRALLSASDIGNCVYEIVQTNNIVRHKRLFSVKEAKSSSTHRELLAFHKFYLSNLAVDYKDCNIAHYTDNMNCEIISTIGSRNFTLQPLV